MYVSSKQTLAPVKLAPYSKKPKQQRSISVLFMHQLYWWSHWLHYIDFLQRGGVRLALPPLQHTSTLSFKCEENCNLSLNDVWFNHETFWQKYLVLNGTPNCFCNTLSLVLYTVIIQWNLGSWMSPLTDNSEPKRRKPFELRHVSPFYQWILPTTFWSSVF